MRNKDGKRCHKENSRENVKMENGVVMGEVKNLLQNDGQIESLQLG